MAEGPPQCYLILMIEIILDKSVKDAITDVVRREMARFGLRDVQAAVGTDHDGDPVIFVDVDYGHAGEAVDVKTTAGLVTKLRDRLWTMGETRFPHIRHHFAAEQKVVGF